MTKFWKRLAWTAVAIATVVGISSAVLAQPRPNPWAPGALILRWLHGGIAFLGTTHEINFGTGLTVSEVDGRATITASGGGEITAGSGLTKSSDTIDVGAGTGISVAADSVAIDLTANLTWTGNETFSNRILGSADIQLANIAAPALPSGNNLVLHNSMWAGFPRFVIDSSVISRPVYSGFGRKRLSWIPICSNTTNSAGELQGSTAAGNGTISHPSLATTNLLTSQCRIERVATATTDGTACSFTNAATETILWPGNAAQTGGYTFVATIATPTNTNGDRGFVGVVANTPSGTVSNTADSIGICYDPGDSSGGNWSVCHNDNSGTGLKDAQTIPRSTTNVYRVTIHVPQNSSSVGVRVDNMTAGTNLVDTTYSSQVPRNSVFLRPWVGQINGTGGVACQFDLIGFEAVVGE